MNYQTNLDLKQIYKKSISYMQGAINLVPIFPYYFKAKDNNQDSSFFGIQKKRIIAFPHAGGNANIFTELAQYLSPEVDFWSIDFPGHFLTTGNRFEDCDALSAFLFESLPRELFLCENLILAGCSMGGCVACAVASLLKKHYKINTKLLILALAPPVVYKQLPKLSALPQKELLKLFLEADSIPKELMNNEQLLKLFMEILYSDFKVFESFNFSKDIVSNQAIVIGGIGDFLVQPEWLFEWKNYFSKVIIDFVPGNHLFIQSYGAMIAERLKAHDFL